MVGGTRSGCYHRAAALRFDSTGLLETLPDLNLARGFHGCAKYLNSKGEKVMMMIRGRLVRIDVEEFSE